MKLQQWRRLFLMSAATAGFFASQTVMALSFQDTFQDLDPAPDPDLLALSTEDEAYVQSLFDRFELTSEQRSQLLHLMDPAVSGAIEGFDLSQEPEAPIPMEEHPEYIELMERIATLPGNPISSCGEILSGGDYYYLVNDIMCAASSILEIGLYVGPGAILDLRGHSVTNTISGQGIGILLDESADLFGGNLKRGVVSGFDLGVLSESNDNLVLHVESSNNGECGICMVSVFTSSPDSYYFYDHRVKYSVANDNNILGIAFSVSDDTTATNNPLSFFGNRVYASEANGNELGISMSATLTSSYGNVGVYRNSVSHSRTNDNGDDGIFFEVRSFSSPTGVYGLNVSENTLSHNMVHCKPTSTCHSDAGITFSAGNAGGTSEIDIVDNSIHANWVGYSAGTGILFSVQEGSGSSDTASENINVSDNHLLFNNVAHNAEGIDMRVTLFNTSANQGISQNINGNLVAFNRAAYSTGGTSAGLDDSVLPGNGIHAVFSFNSPSKVASSKFDDNVIVGNASYQNASKGIALEVIQGLSLPTTLTRDGQMLSNQMLLNQVFSNGDAGLTWNAILSNFSGAKANDNRVAFNRVVNNDTDGMSWDLIVDSATTANAIHNQLDHNIVLDNAAGGIGFMVNSQNSSGLDISYENLVRKNLVTGGTLGIISGFLASNGYSDDSQKNGIFLNLVIESGIGIFSDQGSDNLVHRNYVAKNSNAGITVRDTGDVISKNISILNGIYNLDDLSGATNPADCNDWDDNFFGSINKINPPVCFEVKG